MHLLYQRLDIWLACSLPIQAHALADPVHDCMSTELPCMQGACRQQHARLQQVVLAGVAIEGAVCPIGLAAPQLRNSTHT